MSNYSLDSVSINGFRGLKDLRLDGLGLINVVVGKNNSGKTSVLEAISISYATHSIPTNGCQ